MSATLRHDIGPALANEIRDHDLMLLSVFGVADKARWAGVNKTKQYWECETFAAKLPTDVGHVWELIDILSRCNEKGSRVVAGKLWVSLGLAPQSHYLTAKPNDTEWALLAGIATAPGELKTWGAYGDWLQEQDHVCQQRRGRLIAGWMGKKAMKVKYGVAWFPDEDKWDDVVKRYQSLDWGWVGCILRLGRDTTPK